MDNLVRKYSFTSGVIEIKSANKGHVSLLGQ